LSIVDCRLSKSTAGCLKSAIRNPQSAIRNPQSAIRNLNPQFTISIPNPQSKNPQSQIPNPHSIASINARA